MNYLFKFIPPVKETFNINFAGGEALGFVPSMTSRIQEHLARLAHGNSSPTENISLLKPPTELPAVQYSLNLYLGSDLRGIMLLPYDSVSQKARVGF